MRRFLILLVIILLAAGSMANASHGKLVLITMGGVPLDYVASPNLKNVSRLIDKGAIAVMNSRPASGRFGAGDVAVGGYSMEGSCATIGAGTRTAVTTEARRAYNVGEKVEDRDVKDLYMSLYGQAPGSAEVLHLGMNRLFFINKDAKYPIEPGALGNALHKANLRTAALGNSDTPTDQRREAALIASDSNGIIDFGNVGLGLTMRDPRAPWGMRTNTDALISEFKRVLPKADFIVIDIGDTARAVSYSRRCLETQGEALRRHAMTAVDEVVGAAEKNLDLSKDRIILVSTYPSWISVDNFDFLPPVIAAGNGIKHGLLTSGSTRQPGIITNADISATVINFFGLDAPVPFVGRPVEVKNGTTQELVAINTRIMHQMERQPTMRGLAAFLAIYGILISVYTIWKRKKTLTWVSWAALFPVTLMISVLWLPRLVSFGLVGTVIALAALTLLLIGLMRLIIRSPGASFVVACFTVVVTMLIDLARGSVLLRDSVMSYTPVDGARYYGIGNEHMGSLIAAGMIITGFMASAFASFKWLRRVIIVALPVLITLAIGMPSKGANAGGAMAAAVAVVAGIILWSGRKVTKKHVFAMIIAVPASFGLLMLADSFSSGNSQSHVGRTAHLMASGGIWEILLIIERKLEMNIMLVQHSPWSKLMFILTGAIAVMVWAKHLDVLNRLRMVRDVHSGIIAAGIGALAALLLNDSGVVAAATSLVFVWTAVVLTALAVPKEEGQESDSLPSYDQTKSVRNKAARL